jgi:hypothetical protein
MAFKLPTLCNIPQQIASNLSSFNFGDIKNESSIAKVGYGFAYKATYKNKLQASHPSMKIYF